MKDNDLISAVATQLDEAMASAGWGYMVVQKNQPTQEGIPTAPTVFLEKLFDDAYGWPILKFTKKTPAAGSDENAAAGFEQEEQQWTETTFQISALVIQDPNDLSIPTASDVVNYARQYLNGRACISALRALGVSTLRVKNIRNPYFEDERLTFEASPNFEVVFQHMRILSSSVAGMKVVIEKDIYRV